MRSQAIAIRRADGTELPVEVTSARTEWDGHRAGRVVVTTAADPSARLRHYVTGVFSEVSDAVIVTDLHLHIRSWNASAERIYGWAEHEVLGRHILDVVPWGGDDAELVSKWQILEAEGRWHGEGHQTTRDGSTVTVFASTTLIRDESGEPTGIVSVNRPAILVSADPSAAAGTTHDEAEIRCGIEAGEFEVHYQPVVSLDDQGVIAVEALLRWKHPERGLLGPDAFIEIAERTGVILDLGRLVFDEACHQTARWREAGADIELAVNISTRELGDPDLIERVAATLRRSGLDPKALWLEVTETALVEDVSQATDMLRRVAALGVRIAIDDFGTGWASLVYLRQFPVHALKIDRLFVEGVDRNPSDAAIARSIVHLGRELGLTVIAEGIETVAQQDALRQIGCSLGQGYLYGRPTPAHGVPLRRAKQL
jgi:PAS domain S-box-containing protein